MSEASRASERGHGRRGHKERRERTQSDTYEADVPAGVARYGGGNRVGGSESREESDGRVAGGIRGEWMMMDCFGDEMLKPCFAEWMDD